MDLSFDWRSFQSFFFSDARAKEGRAPGAIQVVIGGGATAPQIVTAQSVREDLSHWVGQPLNELKAQSTHRELLTFDREQIDLAIRSAASVPGFYHQIEHLRQKVRLRPRFSPKNFLLDAFSGWWRRILPVNFGLFIQLEDEYKRPCARYVVGFRSGKIHGFTEADLGTLETPHFLGLDPKRQSQETISHLAGTLGMPFMGLYCRAEAWRRWSLSERPWRELSKDLRAQTARLVPGRWWVRTLIFMKALKSYS